MFVSSACFAGCGSISSSSVGIDVAVAVFDVAVVDVAVVGGGDDESGSTFGPFSGRDCCCDDDDVDDDDDEGMCCCDDDDDDGTCCCDDDGIRSRSAQMLANCSSLTTQCEAGFRR